MKLKLLLFQLFLMVGVIAYAQNDTIKSLIFSEAFIGNGGRNFAEITNMGDDPVNLNQFELGAAPNNSYVTTNYIMLPDVVLQSGESFFISIYHDFSSRNAQYLGVDNYYPEPETEVESVADMVLHVGDYDFFNDQLGIGKFEGLGLDSIDSPNPLNISWARSALYLEQHFPSGDSALIDQILGIWDTPVDGQEGVFTNKSVAFDTDTYDVAGYPNATAFATLVRKYSVKQGNLTFVQGNSEDDSEWIAIENISGRMHRAQPWTYDNHGDYNLEANTLEPMPGSGISVDFQNKIITVPWGTLKPDGIMQNMVKKPGVAWEYILSPVSADSITMGCRTGDSLLIIVVGENADRATFRIEVEEPTASENRVLPMMNEGTDYASRFLAGWSHIRNIWPQFGFGNLSWPWVTTNESGNDSITGYGSSIVNRGIPVGTRIDTLLERLEKTPAASWEIVPVDGNDKRPDLMDGDVLKVTAEDGTVKEYYIKMAVDVGNGDAYLSSITWPDIPDPELYEFLYGWVGDTIPKFSQSVTRYQLKLPSDVEGVPATVAKPSNINAKIEVERAIYLKGSQEDRTTTYTVTATDDTTILKYTVEWQPEVDPESLQPFSAEPFISEWVTREYFQNDYLEICNPGNIPLDLSNYMIVAYTGSATPAEAIAFNPEDWLQRYFKYIPGYKWVDDATWATSPGFVVPDPAVNSIVAGGDVFCLGEPNTNGWWGFGNLGWESDDWPGNMGGQHGQMDVIFYNNTWGNPWGEDVQNGWMPIAEGTYGGEVQYIFKILNDSIKQGTKAATDPNDFELIEILGEDPGTDPWLFGWASRDDGQNFNAFRRKPEINKPNPVLNGSMGDTPEESEFTRHTRYTPDALSGWPTSWIGTCMIDLGQHYFIPSTDGFSTVIARIYQVSPGFDIEDIKGLVTGITVSGFYDGIVKLNEAQELVVKSSADGSELGMDELIANGDTLVVTSADGQNVTKYVLDVTDEGLNSDALITSDFYDVVIEVEPTKSAGETAEAGVGQLTGFEYGTQLKTIINNIDLPTGATMTILDSEGGFVPLKRLNFDTAYVDVTVNSGTYFEVVAEDGITTINYQLVPQASSDAAFITSDYFNVIQSQKLVEFVPGGISVSSLMAKLVPSAGASMKIVDKSGLERTMGNIARDDEVVVTSASGNVTTSYFIQVITSAAPDGPGLGYYLAYITSNFYMVDQVNNMIHVDNSAGAVSITEFAGRLTAHTDGATLEVIDDNGDGMLNDDDMVKVTARDGRFSAMYSIDLAVSSRMVRNNISLYPNPTTGRVNVSGLEVGGRVQVFNYTGAAIRDFRVNSNVETLSLSDQPAGMYLIRISDANANPVGRYKLMKR